MNLYHLGWKIDHLRLGKLLTCVSESLTSPRYHLRLGKTLACDSHTFLIQTKVGVGWGWDVNVHWISLALANREFHTYICKHTR